MALVANRARETRGFLKKRRRLLGDTHREHKTARRNAKLAASAQTGEKRVQDDFNFFTSTLEWRPLWSYFSRRAGGKLSGPPSAKPPLDWK